MHKSREDDERRRVLKEKQQALMAETDEEEALRLYVPASSVLLLVGPWARTDGGTPCAPRRHVQRDRGLAQRPTSSSSSTSAGQVARQARALVLALGH